MVMNAKLVTKLDSVHWKRNSEHHKASCFHSLPTIMLASFVGSCAEPTCSWHSNAFSFSRIKMEVRKLLDATAVKNKAVLGISRIWMDLAKGYDRIRIVRCFSALKVLQVGRHPIGAPSRNGSGFASNAAPSLAPQWQQGDSKDIW